MNDAKARPDDVKSFSEEEDVESQGSRRMDPELRVMGWMLRMLEELDEKARSRVVTWLSHRFYNESKL